MPSLLVCIKVEYPEDLEGRAHEFVRMLEEELDPAVMDPRVDIELGVAFGKTIQHD